MRQLTFFGRSGHLRRPAMLSAHFIGTALAAAGEHRDAVHPGVLPKPMAGHADLAAAVLEQHRLIELGPLLDRDFEPGGQSRGPGQRVTHEPLQIRTTVLAQLKGLGCRGPWSWMRFRKGRGADASRTGAGYRIERVHPGG